MNWSRTGAQVDQSATGEALLQFHPPFRGELERSGAERFRQWCSSRADRPEQHVMMNRRARRRAAALNRRTGYLHRLAAFMPAPGVHVATIEHDRSCAIYRGSGCSCVPNISICGPDGVTVIDERGVARRVMQS